MRGCNTRNFDTLLTPPNEGRGLTPAQLPRSLIFLWQSPPFLHPRMMFNTLARCAIRPAFFRRPRSCVTMMIGLPNPLFKCSRSASTSGRCL